MTHKVSKTLKKYVFFFHTRRVFFNEKFFQLLLKKITVCFFFFMQPRSDVALRLVENTKKVCQTKYKSSLFSHQKPSQNATTIPTLDRGCIATAPGGL